MGAVFTADKLVGLRIANDGLRLRVESNRPPGARHDVAQVRERGGPVPLFDLNPRLPAASDAIEEVAGVRQVDRSAPMLFTVDHRALVIHHAIAEVLTAEFADLRHSPIAI